MILLRHRRVALIHKRQINDMMTHKDIFLANVGDQQAPLASGATPCASKDRDRSPGGTGLCCIALFALLTLGSYHPRAQEGIKSTFDLSEVFDGSRSRGLHQ